MCVTVCVCVCVCVWQCVCVCVFDSVYVCVCVCVRERERDSVCVCVCAFVCVCCQHSWHRKRGAWCVRQCVWVCVSQCVWVCVGVGVGVGVGGCVCGCACVVTTADIGKEEHDRKWACPGLQISNNNYFQQWWQWNFLLKHCIHCKIKIKAKQLTIEKEHHFNLDTKPLHQVWILMAVKVKSAVGINVGIMHDQSKLTYTQDNAIPIPIWHANHTGQCQSNPNLMQTE